MNITKSQLNQIIKEEAEKILLTENADWAVTHAIDQVVMKVSRDNNARLSVANALMELFRILDRNDIASAFRAQLSSVTFEPDR